MTDDEAILLLQQRRATWFLGDEGPSVPPGTSARWRVTPEAPQGWQANMVGYAQAHNQAGLAQVVDTAVGFFGFFGASTWVDTDSRSALWREKELLRTKGFVLHDDWDVLLCRRLVPPRPALVTVRWATTSADLRWAAWIAAQLEATQPVALSDAVVAQRLVRYENEQQGWHTQFVLAFVGEQPVGTARLTAERLPVVVGVATLPQARGRGVGTTLTAALTTHALAEREGCALYVERGSQAARIYARLGYAPLFRTRTWLRRWSAL